MHQDRKRTRRGSFEGEAVVERTHEEVWTKKYLQGMNHTQQVLQSEKLKGACCAAMSECLSSFITQFGPASDLRGVLE